jgi:hypothetical protein
MAGLQEELRKAFIAILIAATAACGHAPAGELAGRATDEWTRTYQIEPNGQVSITNNNGAIEVEGVPGSTTVEVRATRVARAPNDAAARELLPRLTFKEGSDASSVTIQTGRLQGIVIGVEIEVSYQVKVPETASLRLRTSNGAITVTGIKGSVAATNTNGSITGKALAGGVTARTTNESTSIELAAVGIDPVEVRATNGQIHLVLPRTANANLLATATNGTLELKELEVTRFGEQGSRRVRGRINAGGTPVELSAVNGKVVVEGR